MTFKKFIFFLYPAVLLFALFFFAKEALAANFYFSPSRGNVYKGENFSVNILISSDVSVNAMSGIVNFPTEYLEAVSVNNGSNSIIDLWVQKPSFSNAGATGNVRFEGVALNPGFAGSAGEIVKIVFRVKKEGSAGLNFSEFAILANNGLGTNISQPNGSAVFTLLPVKVLPQEKAEPSVDLRAVEDKIKVIERRISEVENAPPAPVIAEETGILRFWDIFPRWVRVSIIALVGVAAMILSLVIVSLGLLVVVWLWSRIWRKRGKIAGWIGLLPARAKKIFRKTSKDIDFAEHELVSDVKYGARLIEKDFKEAEGRTSFKKTVKDYWLSIAKIFKRFTTRNLRK